MDPIKLKTKATIDSVLGSAGDLRRRSDAFERRIASLLSDYSLNVTTDVESGSQAVDEKSSSGE